MERGLRCAATASLLALVVLLLPTPGLAQSGLPPGGMINGIDCDYITRQDCASPDVRRTCLKECPPPDNPPDKEPKSPKRSASPGLDPDTPPRVRPSAAVELERFKKSMEVFNMQPTLTLLMPSSVKTPSVAPSFPSFVPSASGTSVKFPPAPRSGRGSPVIRG
ncbi:hypothetical protein QJQ45_030345 [Haematococcus lacustris]|nr:hypothetical protein QJQ45_030345 [Haematococcus lacustris]